MIGFHGSAHVRLAGGAGYQRIEPLSLLGG
jgi:hypothetical protein